MFLKVRMYPMLTLTNRIQAYHPFQASGAILSQIPSYLMSQVFVQMFSEPLEWSN